MPKKVSVISCCCMALCMLIMVAYTSSAQAQANQIHIFADRNTIPEGTTASIVIEAQLTRSAIITASTMEDASAVVLSTSELALSSGNSFISFEVSVPDNDEPQAGNKTFTVQFTAAPAIPNLRPLSFIVPPNDLIASVSTPVELSLDNTTNTVMIDIEPRPQNNKSFMLASMNTRFMVTADMITSSVPPFAIDVALNLNNPLGPAEQLNLTIHYIDSYQPLTAQAQIGAGISHTCAIRPDNTVACWGDNSFDQTSLTSSPDPDVNVDTRFLAISAGAGYTCGIKAADQMVACWGFDSDGSTRPTSAPGVDASTRFLAVAAGGTHSCGIKADGRMACWGDDTGHSTVPANADGVHANTRFLAVGAGWVHSCGIKVDGRIACWGVAGQGRTNPSSSPDADATTRFLAVSGGWSHTCGIKTDGRMACWGFDSDGSTRPTSAPGVDASTRFLAVDAAGLRTCGIKVDGRVACWGVDSDGNTMPSSAPGVDANTRFLAVSGGSRFTMSHTCGIKVDGRVACWGSNDNDKSNPSSVGFQQASTTADVVYLAERSTIVTNAVKLEQNIEVKILHPQLLLTESETMMFTLFEPSHEPSIPITITLIVADADKHVLNLAPEPIVLTADNPTGQTTITATDDDDFANIDPVTLMFAVETDGRARLTPSETITVAIANNDFYKLGFTHDHIMLAEGQSTNVSLSIDPPPTRLVVVVFPITTDAVYRSGQLDINPSHVLFSPTSTQREVMVTAVDDLLPEDTARFTVAIASLTDIPTTVANTLSVEVSADTDPAIINTYTASNMIPEGTTATVVVNAALRQSIELQLNTAAAPMSAPTMTRLSASTVSLSSALSSVQFDVYVNDNNEPQTSNSSFNVILAAPAIATQTLTFTVPPNDLSAVVTRAATFRVTDTIHTMTMVITPPLQDRKSFVATVADPRLTTTAGIMSQARSSLLIDLALTEGTRLSRQEQLNVAIYHIDSRAPFSKPTAQAQISAANKHSCAITADNTIACWGSSTINRTNPIGVDGIDATTRFIAISAGNDHSCAIKTNNTVACWSSSSSNRSHPIGSPQGVTTNAKFLAISAGGDHSCGIKADNTIACWGSPINNRTSPSSSPQGVSANTRFLAIDAGNDHSCGIKADSTVACWGSPINNRTNPSSSPQGVSANTRFVAISAGGAHSCGIKIDGQVACWGANDNNQSHPISGPSANGNTRFIAISAGGAHSCGIKSIDGTALCWGTNNSNQSHPTSAPTVDANTRFIAISAGGAHSCGIKADSTAVCWGSDDNRTNASTQRASNTADMVHLTEYRQIVPRAVEFQAVSDIAILHPQIMLDRDESMTLTLFTLLNNNGGRVIFNLERQDPNTPPALSVNLPQRILSPANPRSAITLSVNGVGASTYIDNPVRLIFQAITGNVRLTPTDTITVEIANHDLRRVGLATAAITMAEGDTGTITLNIEPLPTTSVTVNLVNSSTDQITVDSIATFAPGSSTTTATISIIDDNDKEKQATHIIRLTAAEADTRTYISTPELAVTIPADKDRAIIITVNPTSLQLSPDDSAAIHLAVPPRFAITTPITIVASSDNFITVTPTQLVLRSTMTSAALAVALTPNITAADATSITLTATSADSDDEPQLTADNITITITDLGIKLRVKLYLEGALP